MITVVEHWTVFKSSYYITGYVFPFCNKDKAQCVADDKCNVKNYFHLTFENMYFGSNSFNLIRNSTELYNSF